MRDEVFPLLFTQFIVVAVQATCRKQQKLRGLDCFLSKYTPFDDGVTTALSPIEVYFWLITTTVDKLTISSPPLK